MRPGDLALNDGGQPKSILCAASHPGIVAYRLMHFSAGIVSPGIGCSSLMPSTTKFSGRDSISLMLLWTLQRRLW